MDTRQVEEKDQLPAVAKIHRFDLQVGQWVMFHTKQSSLSEAQQEIYDDKFFLVVTREDAMFDSCRCLLVDDNGEKYDYCPRMGRLGDVNLLSDGEIYAVSSRIVELDLKKEKIEFIYDAAKKLLIERKAYFDKYPAEILDIQSILDNLKAGKTQDKDYSVLGIPPAVVKFFSEEKGLNPEMLLRKGWSSEWEKKDCCDMIDTFRRATFSLIRFYLQTPEFSVKNLLAYDAYAIRDLAVHDKGFRFHNWLLKNGLTMPPALVEQGGKWYNIPSLCDLSGIEFLNRKILSYPKEQQQNQLNELVKCDCEREKAISLQDSLVSPSEVSWNTIEDRFLKFKEKEKAPVTGIQTYSVFSKPTENQIKDVDITDEEMANSTFGQESNLAKSFSKR